MFIADSCGMWSAKVNAHDAHVIVKTERVLKNQAYYNLVYMKLDSFIQ